MTSIRSLSCWTILAGLCAACGGGGGSGGDGDADADADADADGDADACAGVAGEPCEVPGAVRCSPDGTATNTCVASDDCLVWGEPVACDPGARCVDAACVPCDGPVGTQYEQVLEVDGEERAYLLHVPTTYDCAAAWPALVDFHGTAGDFAEEAYATEELLDLAEREQFIAIRPRSRFSEEGGGRTYRWDQNPGDLERNHTFTLALVEDVARRYRLDRGRLYASGFSSGTNMVSQFVGDTPAVFSGFAFVGGGTWEAPDFPAWAAGADAPRMYAVTGYRDYMQSYLRTLRERLAASAYPEDAMFRREVDTGHELYGWHFEELWGWLDRAERPPDGTLAAGWSREDGVDAGDTLLELARAPSGGGDILAGASGGAIWRRDAAGAWSLAARLEDDIAPAWSGACLGDDGVGLVVGEGKIARTDDFGQTWALGPPVPELAGAWFGSSYLNTVACGPSRIVAAGYWTGVRSDDGGETWDAAPMDAGGYPAQLAAVRIAPDGASVAVGYYHYVGHSDDGASFTMASRIPGAAEWFNDVAVAADGRFWVVGEKGTILSSDDGGATWDDHSVAGAGDLYAVEWSGDDLGMAVGLHGQALLTVDGGGEWQDVSVGLDRALTDALFVDDARVLVVGERGTAVLYDLP